MQSNKGPVGERRTESEDIGALLERTHHSDPRVRSAAVHALCPCSLQADYEQVWDRLLEMVGDPDPRVRADVFHTLCDGSPRHREGEIVRALESMYNDPDRKLRRRIRHLLAQYRSGGKLNVL